MKIKFLSILFIAASIIIQAADKTLSVLSPDKRTELKVTVGDKISYSVSHDGKVLISPSSISITLIDGKVLGAKPQLANQKSIAINREIKTLYGNNAILKDNYNELLLSFKGDYAVAFRAYNEGTAYRFITSLKDKIKIKNEEVTYTIPEDYKGFFIRGNKDNYIYEGLYKYENISKIDSGRAAALPIVIDIPNGPKISLTESDVLDYPGMYLENYSGKTLVGAFRKYPLKLDTDNMNEWNVHATEKADYIAHVSGTRNFPWRMVMIMESDKDLMNNELVYLLASEPKKGTDFSWVKPGLIINDWWDAIWTGYPQEVILTGVNFTSGTNYDTYKYYIDFAIQHNIEYVNIDYGWSDPQDFSKILPKFDLPKLLQYSKEKNKKVILWCIAKTLYKNLEENMAMFEKWGIGGLKVDFFERDDQLCMYDYERIAEAAARHHLLLEYHGASKPTGLSRTYPNILTYEAVLGSEHDKFYETATPNHDVTMPFMRSLAGAFDYGPGAMYNANKRNFKVVQDRPMSQGTRIHQLAMYMNYYSPLQFMVDVPTNYIKEPEYLKFLASIPSTWDATYPLDSKIGQYVTVARKKGKTWFVGSMTNWDARTIKIKCDFLEKGEYSAEIYSDGLNADRNGNDYQKTVIKIKAGEELTLPMAPGGGWVAKFSKQ